MIDPAIVLLAKISGVITTILIGVIIYMSKKEKKVRHRPSVFNDLRNQPVITPVATAVMDVIPQVPVNEVSNNTYEPLTTAKPTEQPSDISTEENKVNKIIKKLQSKEVEFKDLPKVDKARDSKPLSPRLRSPVISRTNSYNSSQSLAERPAWVPLPVQLTDKAERDRSIKSKRGISLYEQNILKQRSLELPLSPEDEVVAQSSGQ